MVVNIDYQLGRVWSHLGEKVLGVPVRESMHCVSEVGRPTRPSIRTSFPWIEVLGRIKIGKQAELEQPLLSASLRMQCEQLPHAPDTTPPLP